VNLWKDSGAVKLVHAPDIEMVGQFDRKWTDPDQRDSALSS